MRTAFIVLLSGLAACADVPALEDRIDAAARNAPYPALINIDPLVAQLGAPPPTADPLSGRIAALQARADGLRGAVIAPPLRARLAQGVNTSALP